MTFLIFFSGQLFFIVPSLSNVKRLAYCKPIFLRCRNATWNLIKISARKTSSAVLFTVRAYKNLTPVPKLLVILGIAQLVVWNDDHGRMAIAKKRHELWIKRNYVKTGEWDDLYRDIDYTTTIKFVLGILLVLGLIKVSLGPDGLTKMAAKMTWKSINKINMHGNRVP